MVPALDQRVAPVGGNTERNRSPPAFLDLANSAARQGANLPDVNSRIEQKRMEHERQRLQQRKIFEEQMRMLEHQQALEEQKLMGSPALGGAPMNPALSLIGSGALQHHPAMSAPTTPPRTNSVLQPISIHDGDLSAALSSHALAPGSRLSNGSLFSGVSFGTPQSAFHSPANTTEKRKSVNYADFAEYNTYSPDATATHAHTVAMPSVSQFGSHTHTAGAKSMPGSRRGSGNHGDLPGINLQGLSIRDSNSNSSNQPGQPGILKNGAGIFGPTASQSKGFNPGFLLDEELDKEVSRDMHKSVNFLPLSSEEEPKSLLRSDSYSKLSASSAALDLAPLSQTPPRGPGPNGRLDNAKSSEWPLFSGGVRPNEQARMRNVTNPGPIGGSRPSSGMGGNTSSSPTAIPSDIGIVNSSARSVPATPMSARQNMPGKTVGLPSAGDVGTFTGDQNTGGYNMNRLSGAFDTPVTFNSVQSAGNDENFSNNISGDMGGAQNYNSFDYEGGPRNNAHSGSTALYQHNGSRYGLALGNGRFMSQENNKMGGLHGTKHKRGDMDREFNRFAGTRLEDLVGEIPALCKDQHGCRYLQKKLEEGVPEHRDIIFHETFSLFAELMTDPFGNYLCQKLLEYSTDEQRNMICESVAHDLVGISLNMHGTRAVQKMIDFLSTQRQANPSSYDAQIHSIIVALSMHVVTLIKDLNGNHVIQKCLNRLIPEDNQFIYNAVAAHCVEVATHRHGCCVLQRCIDHASDQQRIQLVTEITFNALTLVQDPYGNYVVQYILDLNDNRFSDAVIRQFIGNVCALSVQKFSSNVIEKCIRVAEHTTRKMLIEELLNRNRLEKLLRDSFGNYCVQTALDYAEPTQRMLLVEGIRPILPLIRNTPYGKRIQSKLQREQMENHQQYGGGHGGYNPTHAALVNLAMNGNGMSMGGRHVSQPSVHHSPLADAYNRPNLYNIPQQMHHGIQQQPMDHYGTPHMMASNLHHSPMTTTAAFPNVSGFSNPVPNNYGALGISAGMNDPYQRANFPYGM
ncbi:Pumilio homology domain family member 4 [Saccharomyces cerevisiae S288c] [Rhizoctonia solani]|uniref:Pumilio homology domain family member 4 [Saccharomyces cerevisiae S288c] n=1 Tax=Rhizoctonia solani TaxID=456999 RepID=A0A0K6GFU0_9AGAM|nr:Pumilio homology domain family member 4 [Saccharomyces cerevisiae S288c] [Rhizoctonia solani]